MDNPTEFIRKAWLDTPADHKATLLGERSAGSKWGRPFAEDDFEELVQGWVEHYPDPAMLVVGCRYFWVGIECDFPEATQGAVAWSDLQPSVRSQVEVVEGDHGPELQLRCRQKPVQADDATIIIGLSEGKQVVFTIHPGWPLRPYDGTPLWSDATGMPNLGETAVKLVEGDTLQGNIFLAKMGE
jgi:hypothetical protein